MSKLRVEQKVDEDLEYQQLQQHLTKQQQQHVQQQQQHSVALAGHPKSYVDILQQSLAREQQRLAAEEQQKAKQDKLQQQKQRKQSIPSENKASNNNNNNQLQKQHAVTAPQQQGKAPIPQQQAKEAQQQQAKEVQQQQHVQQQQQQHVQQPQLKAPIPQQQAKEIHKNTTNHQAISNIPQFSLANPSQVEGDFKQEKQEVFQYILHQHNALHHIKLYILQLQATNDHFTHKCAHALENKAQNHHGLPHYEKDTHHLLNDSTLDDAMKPLSVLLNQNAQHFQRVISLTNDPNAELKSECQNFFNSFLTNQYQLYELLHDIKKLEERCQAWGQKVLGMNIMKLTLTEMMSRAANPATHAEQVWQPSANCSSSTSLKDHINAVPFLPRQHFMQQEEQQQPSAKHGVDTDHNNVHSQASHAVHPIAAPPQPQRMEAKLPQPIKLPLESQQQQQQSQQETQKKKDVPQQNQKESLRSTAPHMDTTNRRRSLADLVAENNQKKLTNHTPSNNSAHSRDGQHTGIGGGGSGSASAQKLANGIGAAGGTAYRRGSTASINNNNDHNGQHHVSFAPAIPSSVQQDSLVLKFRPGSASSSTSATSTTSAAPSVGPDGLTRSQRRKQFWLSYLDKHPEKKDAMYHKNNDIAMSKTEKGQQIDDKHKKEVEEKLARDRAKKESLENRSVINGAYIQALPNAAVITVNTDSVNGANDYTDVDFLVL